MSKIEAYGQGSTFPGVMSSKPLRTSPYSRKNTLITNRDSEEENSENMVVPSSSTRKRRQIQSDTEDEHFDR